MTRKGENNPAPALYQDYAGRTCETLEELARYRASVMTPLFGGDTVCPAAQYTFAVSQDQGATWRNPSPEEILELAGPTRAGNRGRLFGSRQNP